jgi:hypothetical protein
MTASQEVEVGGSQTKNSPRQKHETLSEKQTKSKRIWGMAQVVESLSSIPSITKKKKKKGKI